MKKIFLLLFLVFITSNVYAQQENTSAAFVHLTKIDKVPYSAECTERSPACTAAEIEKYLLKNITGIGKLSELETGKIEIPVRVIIDTEGKVSWTSVKELPEEAAKQLASRLKEMPVFIPGEHEGEKANVIVDLRFSLYFHESKDPGSTVVFVDKAEQPPIWKNCRRDKDPVACTAIAINDWMNRKVRTSVLKEPGSYRLTAAFVIGEDGKVSRIVVLGGGEYFAQEVIDQLKKMPQLEPGKNAGEPVAVSYLLPMSFMRL